MKILKAFIGAVALATPALITANAPASAALSQCNSNYMCAWGNNNHEWLIAEQRHGQGSWLDPFNAEENDETDSYANRSVTYTGCLSQHAGGGGDRVTMKKNHADDNLASFNSDEASRMRTKYGC